MVAGCRGVSFYNVKSKARECVGFGSLTAHQVQKRPKVYLIRATSKRSKGKGGRALKLTQFRNASFVSKHKIKKGSSTRPAKRKVRTPAQRRKRLRLRETLGITKGRRKRKATKVRKTKKRRKSTKRRRKSSSRKKK